MLGTLPQAEPPRLDRARPQIFADGFVNLVYIVEIGCVSIS